MHRVAQLVGHVRARMGPDDEALVRRLLPPGPLAAFAQMPMADQRHGLDAARHLLAAGHRDADLLAAALLHDVAKGYRLRLWHRVAGVLLAALTPRLLARLASPRERSWRYPFHLFLEHGPMSADAALAAGCSERCAEFIRGSSSELALQAALRAADEAS
jgi:hypothetical protein